MRIEDTDRNRSRHELTDTILESLRWLGLQWDEGPYHQADNLELHQATAARLLEEGQGYRCFCTAEELEERRSQAAASGGGYTYDGRCRDLKPSEVDDRLEAGEPFSVRFRMPAGETVWEDIVHGSTRFANEEIEDFVLLRSDQTPTYHLAVVADDIEMGITHIIRGADHTSNTPKQIQLYRALGHEPPIFAHVPLILGPDGKRLSKRHGATSVEAFRDEGFVAQALINFLALLGWSPGEDREYMEVEELIERFSLEQINKKSAIFDTEKLLWLNGEHLSKAPAEQIALWLAPFLTEIGLRTSGELERSRGWWHDVIDLVKVRARTLTDLTRQVRPFFEGAVEHEPEAVAKHWKDAAAVAERLRKLSKRLRELGDWSEVTLEQELRALAAELDVGAGKLIHPLRVALTGAAVSPGIFEVMQLMGKKLVLARIDEALVELMRLAADREDG